MCQSWSFENILNCGHSWIKGGWLLSTGKLNAPVLCASNSPVALSATGMALPYLLYTELAGRHAMRHLTCTSRWWRVPSEEFDVVGVRAELVGTALYLDHQRGVGFDCRGCACQHGLELAVRNARLSSRCAVQRNPALAFQRLCDYPASQRWATSIDNAPGV